MMAKPAAWQSGLILASVAAICTALVAVTFSVTKDRIAANERAHLERSLQPVLEGLSFDNDLAGSLLLIRTPHELPGSDNALIYRARSAGEPVAAVFAVTAPDGFSGPIRLLIGVAADGVVSGVRAIAHQETPGIGDLIDTDRSDWVLDFAGTSLANPGEAQWSIRRDGGAFDQLTGASVTSRATINAVKETLLYFDANGDVILSAPATNDDN